MLDRPGLTKIEAELYALTHRGQRGDAEFYAGQCARVGRVLELGTGYGRLLGPLSATAELVGLDRDPELLAAARRQMRGPLRGQGRRVRLVEGDFTSFQLPGTFDRIVMPYNALYCLLGRRALLRCFQRVRAHLAEGGQFLFDVWSADGFQRSTRRASRRAGHRDDDAAIVSLHHRGQVWDVFEHSRLRSARQRLDVLYTYVPRSGGAPIDIRIEQRYAPWAEIAALLAQAGLQVSARYGGFARERWSPHSDQLVVIAEGR
ncbi:MAG: hypothetical protein RL685_1993 [Pseudomonadota bacterium]